MLKKKNIAMAMAVATVATSVAPAFAATQNVDETTLISKVKELIDVKYFGTEERVYEIRINDTTAEPIKDIKELERAIATAKIDNTKLTVYTKDLGHAVVNGRIEKNEMTKYTRYTADTLVQDAKSILALTNVGKSVVYYNEKGNVCADSEAVKAVVELTSGQKLELVEGANQLDLTKAVDTNGNRVVLDGITPEAGKRVVGFELKEDTNATSKPVPSKTLDTLVFNAKEDTKIERNLTDFYNANGYTKKGVDLVNKLIDAHQGMTQLIYNGKEYTLNIADTNKDVSNITVNNAGKYEFTVNVKVEEGNKATFTDKAKDIKLVISSDTHKDLTAVRTDIVGNVDVEEGKGKYKTLAGANRFETAVEISKESFDKYDNKAGTKGNANAVVLVGEDAIVDGLAAAPLARQKNAPILLTKKDAISDKTMNEIKRVVDKNSTVYIVGGENVISKDVEAQLIKEMNAKIVRLAGNSRYETSVKIAENMKKEVNSTTPAMDQAFVVGGFGEADAMSIAAVAANKTDANKIAPIIVSPESGLTQDAKDFLYKNKTALTNVDVVGGTSKVSNQVVKDIKANVDSTDEVARIAGYNRQETNAQVISKFYKKGSATELNGVYVAKDGTARGNGELIDALAVAPLAGKTSTPIVLATDKISEEQVDAIEKNATTGTKTMTQAGAGIAQTVLDKLVKLLSL